MGPRTLRKPGAIFFVGLAALLAAVAIALGGAELRRTGSNDTVVQVEIGSVPPGARACQPHEGIAKDSEALRLSVGATAGVARIRLRLHGRSGPLTEVGSGSAAIIPLPAPPQLADETLPVCFENAGPAPLLLYGAQTGPVDQIVIRHPDGSRSRAAGRVHVDGMLSSAPVTGWHMLDKLPDRVATATGVSFAPWLVCLGLLFGVAAVALLLAREEDRT